MPSHRVSDRLGRKIRKCAYRSVIGNTLPNGETLRLNRYPNLTPPIGANGKWGRRHQPESLSNPGSGLRQLNPTPLRISGERIKATDFILQSAQKNPRLLANLNPLSGACGTHDVVYGECGQCITADPVYRCRRHCSPSARRGAHALRQPKRTLSKSSQICDPRSPPATIGCRSRDGIKGRGQLRDWV